LDNYYWVASQPLIDSIIQPTIPNFPLVAVIMGSQTDWETMKITTKILEKLGVSYETKIISAHRTPERMFAFARTARSKGYHVIIAGAGGAAHLPGMIASLTTLPVLGVPIKSKTLNGIDSLLSIVQMPGGIPVGSLAIGDNGALNAGLLAASIVSLNGKHSKIEKNLLEFRESQSSSVSNFPIDYIEKPSNNSTPTFHLKEISSFPNKTIPPGSIIGILGGGQLARMICIAAAQLGYKTHIYCPDKCSPAFQVAESNTIADYGDQKSLCMFAGKIDVVTYEFENIPKETLEYLEQWVPVRPKPSILGVSQKRVSEKSFLNLQGIQTTQFESIENIEELKKYIIKIGYPAILKTDMMGYDGKGQITINEGDDLGNIWKRMSEQMNCKLAILESFVDFSMEVSVIVCRGLFGQKEVYPLVENRHENYILRETIVPAPVSDEVKKKSEEIAFKIADRLDLVGVLAIEMFLKRDGNILVNELAPRPHNSGHWTIEGCNSSQFDQLLRCICGLPLGSTKLLSEKITMKNLLGDEIKNWKDFLSNPNAHIHIYGKKETRPGRKMGHLTFLTQK